ncbi:flavin reductase [Candidatus Woesearchaeota archaeon]|nr:flavin reductase [Candidatus Woesearchaeota archaeon]
MDLPWGDIKTQKFVTNVGLITSNGPHGNNIMAAEWTHHISYSPGLIAVSIGTGKATAENIEKTKEFGISICADDQIEIAAVSGSSSGKNVDKIKVLQELGHQLYKARKINVFMVKDAVLNLECKLKEQISSGDHILFIGELLEANVHENKTPAVYHKGKFWKFGENLPRPTDERIAYIKKLAEKHAKAEN